MTYISPLAWWQYLILLLAVIGPCFLFLLATLLYSRLWPSKVEGVDFGLGSLKFAFGVGSWLIGVYLEKRREFSVLRIRLFNWTASIFREGDDE